MARLEDSFPKLLLGSPIGWSDGSCILALWRVIFVHHDDEETGAVDVQSIGPEEQSAAEQERVPLTIFHFPQR